MRIFILISTIALLNWGSVASASTRRKVDTYTEPIAKVVNNTTPEVPRTGIPVQDIRRRNLRQIRNSSISETPIVPGSPTRRRSAGPEGIPLDLSLPPAQPASPSEPSTTTTSSTSTASSAKSVATPIKSIQDSANGLKGGDKSSSSSEPSSSTTASPSSSQSSSKNEVNDNLSKYLVEISVEIDRFIRLLAKKVKGNPKQGR